MRKFEHEYAGFHYTMTVGDDGRVIGAVPLPGQHPAASKERHRRAAIEQAQLDMRKKPIDLLTARD